MCQIVKYISLKMLCFRAEISLNFIEPQGRDGHRKTPGPL